MTRLLLVHPPLLGPSVWQKCAAVLRDRGHSVTVPDLRTEIEPASGWWARWAERCAKATADVDVVAGHSGSGVVLPMIAEATRARSVAFVDAVVPSEGSATTPSESLVAFVDAVVPSEGSATTPSESLVAFVRSLPSDDHLPPWTTWWPEDDVAEILPDPELRAQIAAEEPRLPADFYDHAVPVPPHWTARRSITYVRFSAAYEDDAAEADRRNWSVRHVPGSHLHLLDQPAALADVLLTAAKPDSQCPPSQQA